MKLLHKKIIGCLAVPFLALILMRAMFLFYDFLFQANSASDVFMATWVGVGILTRFGVALVVIVGDEFL